MTASDGSWWVYLLYSERAGLTYTGVTTRLEFRIRQHNGELVGGARATFRGRPWIVRYTEGPMPKVDAMRREYTIKQLSRNEKLALGVTTTTG